MKKKMTIRVSEDLYNLIEKHSDNTRISKTEIIERALRSFFEEEGKTDKQIEFYEKENEHLKMLIKVLQERENALKKVEEGYERLIKEKEERIKELQERIKEK